MIASLLAVTNRIAVLFMAFLLFSLSGCGGSSSPPATDAPIDVSFSQVQNFSFTVAGQPADFTTVNTIDVAALGGPFESLTIDLTKALGNITGPTLKPAPGAKTQIVTGASGPLSSGAIVEHYIGMGEEQDDLCGNAARLALSIEIFLNASDELDSVQPGIYSAPQEIVDIYNTGSVATCTRVIPNVNVVASMSGLEAEYEKCTQAPFDFDGDWSGTYSCTGSCPDPGGLISLTVNQNGGTATYFDDGVGAAQGNYSGFVCGDVFSFSGGASTYEESGKLISTGPNSAKKTSFFRTNPTCSGSCTDFLTRP
jgi:hypothetical protein